MSIAESELAEVLRLRDQGATVRDIVACTGLKPGVVGRVFRHHKPTSGVCGYCGGRAGLDDRGRLVAHLEQVVTKAGIADGTRWCGGRGLFPPRPQMPQGVCPDCGRMVAVLADGRIHGRTHFRPDGLPCTGMGKPSIKETK